MLTARIKVHTVQCDLTNMLVTATIKVQDETTNLKMTVEIWLRLKG